MSCLGDVSRVMSPQTVSKMRPAAFTFSCTLITMAPIGPGWIVRDSSFGRTPSQPMVPFRPGSTLSVVVWSPRLTVTSIGFSG